MKEKHDEDVSEFINRFKKWYNILPTKIKPPHDAAKVVFARNFEPYFGVTLIERKSRSLDQIQIDALEVEEKFTSNGNWKGKTEYGDMRRGKEESNLCNLSCNENMEYSTTKLINFL